LRSKNCVYRAKTPNQGLTGPRISLFYPSLPALSYISPTHILQINAATKAPGCFISITAISLAFIFLTSLFIVVHAMSNKTRYTTYNKRPLYNFPNKRHFPNLPFFNTQNSNLRTQNYFPCQHLQRWSLWVKRAAKYPSPSSTNIFLPLAAKSSISSSSSAELSLRKIASLHLPYFVSSSYSVFDGSSSSKSSPVLVI
jgi:hypothetical protein